MTYWFVGVSLLLCALWWAGLQAHQAQQERISSMAKRAATAATAKESTPAPKPTPKGCSPRKQKCVYLTFDDGPWELTPKFLKVLEEKQVHATFFLLGRNLNTFPEGVEALKESHVRLGNHTWDHPYLPALPAASQRWQLVKTQKSIKKHFELTSRCYRAPYGATSTSLRALGRELGLRHKAWEVDPEDWRTPGSKVIVKRVLEQVKPGAIILLHDGGGDRRQTLRALPELIDKLRARGYEFGEMCREK